MARAAWAITGGVVLLLSTTARAATFVVVNADPPGVGFNDATAASPVAGNTQTTRGAQALTAFQYAADLWGARIASPVPIRVLAEFAPLACTATTGVVGSATPQSYKKDSAGAPPGIWLPAALANSLAGVDLDTSQPDIVAKFNGAMGTLGCLSATKWYFGLDGQPGSGADFVTLVLHELAHGLGVSTPVDLTTGALFQGSLDAFAAHVYDERTGLTWGQMSDAERADSAKDTRQLSWDGPAVTAEAPAALSTGVATLTVGAPVSLTPMLGLSSFGPAFPSAPLTATVVAVNDSVSYPYDGCEPIASVAGQIAFVQAGGGCSDLTKVTIAQAGGAVAAILVDDQLAPPPLPLTGIDPGGTIGIPAMRISQRDAMAMLPYLGTLSATIVFDATRMRGASPAGRVYLHAPDPVVVGSSVTHWDPVATPDLLMEPVVRVGHGVDLTLALLVDIGWSMEPIVDGGAADAAATGGGTAVGSGGGGSGGTGPLADAAPPLDACSGAPCGDSSTGGAASDASGLGGVPSAGGTAASSGGSGGNSGTLVPGFPATRHDPSCACRAAGGLSRPGALPPLLVLFPVFLVIGRRRRARSIYTHELSRTFMRARRGRP